MCRCSKRLAAPSPASVYLCDVPEGCGETVGMWTSTTGSTSIFAKRDVHRHNSARVFFCWSQSWGWLLRAQGSGQAKEMQDNQPSCYPWVDPRNTRNQDRRSKSSGPPCLQSEGHLEAPGYQESRHLLSPCFLTSSEPDTVARASFVCRSCCVARKLVRSALPNCLSCRCGTEAQSGILFGN